MRQTYIFLILICLGGCAESEGTGKSRLQGGDSRQNIETVSILTWNMQALFDGVEAGNEYPEYRSGWTEEKYLARITAFSQALKQLPKSPDILAFEEMENAGVAEALAAVSGPDYRWTAFSAHPGQALGLGIVSRFPPTALKAHSITWAGETIPRPVLEFQFEARGRLLTLFVCHWKSKLGGDTATETLRRAAARIILRRLAEIHLEDPHMPIIIMGDLNENYDEFYRHGGTMISALLPDDPDAAKLAGFGNKSDSVGQTDFLIVNGERPPQAAHFTGAFGVFYSPWQELKNGSYYYQDTWENIDHFLLTGELFDESDWEFDSCTLLDREPFINTRGFPRTYNPRTGSGLSDHLPLLLSLRMEQ